MADDLELIEALKGFSQATRGFGKAKVELRRRTDELVEVMRTVLNQIAIQWIGGDRWIWCFGDSNAISEASQTPEFKRKCVAVMGVDGQFRIVIAVDEGTSVTPKWTFDRTIENATWKEADLLDLLPEFLVRYSNEVKKTSEVNAIWIQEILRQADLWSDDPVAKIKGRKEG